MEIDEKSLRQLVEERRVSDPGVQVMDSGMNVSLSVSIARADGSETPKRFVLHTRQGGVRIMSPQKSPVV